MNTSRFTALNTLFLNNSHIFYWRFEVVYTFVDETSLSALNFVINQRPENGTCSIYPRTGTASTPFQINCSDWVDEEKIKDYSFYTSTTPSEQVMLAFTTDQNPVLALRLPARHSNGSVVTVTVHIRDELNCVREHVMESVTVFPDRTFSDTFIDAIENFDNESANNPIVQALASRNQNAVSQAVTYLSQEFNERNRQEIDTAVQSKDIINVLFNMIFILTSRWYSCCKYLRFTIGKSSKNNSEQWLHQSGIQTKFD